MNQGLSQMAAGEAVFKWSTAEKTWPVSAGTFNHRAEALYRCAAEFPHNPFVADCLQRGLKNVKMMYLVVNFSSSGIIFTSLRCTFVVFRLP